MSSPKTYRVCLYDSRYKTLSAELIEAASDDEAVAKARSAGPSAIGEVWEGTRLVTRFGKEIVPPSSTDWGLPATL